VGATPFTFTPLDPVDTFDVYLLGASGQGTLDIDGGEATAVNLNVANRHKRLEQSHDER
jgi:hypothetical protein